MFGKKKESGHQHTHVEEQPEMAKTPPGVKWSALNDNQKAAGVPAVNRPLLMEIRRTLSLRLRELGRAELAAKTIREEVAALQQEAMWIERNPEGEKILLSVLERRETHKTAKGNFDEFLDDQTRAGVIAQVPLAAPPAPPENVPAKKGA